MKEQKNEVVTKQNSEVANQEENVLMGFENTDMGEMTLARAKLMQTTSTEVEDGDARPGQVIHDALLMDLADGDGNYIFIPIAFSDGRILLKPKNEPLPAEMDGDLFNLDSDVVCRSANGKEAMNGLSCASCPYGKWNGNRPPLCNDMTNVLALFGEDTIPVVLTFMKTSAKYGKKFKKMAIYAAQKAGGALFRLKFKLTVKKEQNDKGNFFTYSAKPCGNTSEDEYGRALAAYKQFANIDVGFNVTSDEEGVEGPTEY